MISRRGFLTTAGVVGAGGLGLGVAGALAAHALRTTRYTLGAEDSGRGMRIAVLTDLHLQEVGEFEAAIAAAVSELDPDVTVIVGDSVDNRRGLRALPGFLALLPRTVPTFATLGNWEYWSGVDLADVRRRYADHGVRLLVNEWATLPDGRLLFGSDDLVGGRPRVETPPSGSEALLLSHCPALRDEALPQFAGFAGMVSGHTHGGQIRLGSWAPVRPPGSGSYVVGKYEGAGIDLLVSQGLGTSMLPVRLGAPPEVLDVTWHASHS